mmetsp:Transcript_123689/g.194027  ORF Transcript_123689/g.194027 Transcript_123689/m.194027 type:complete len:203 (+) Transcript_123689:82-690(+)
MVFRQVRASHQEMEFLDLHKIGRCMVAAAIAAYVYPIAMRRLQRSQKVAAKIGQSSLKLAGLAGVLSSGCSHVWSCLRYLFLHMPPFPTIHDAPWCLGVAAALWGGIALHAAMVCFLTVGWEARNTAPNVNELLATCTPCLALPANAADCPICYVSFEDSGVDDMVAPICRHEFHKACLRSWLERHPTCPVCRYDLSESVCS